MRGDLFIVFFGQSTTADRVHRPGVGDYAVAVFDLKLHPIGVKGEEDVGLPYNMCALFAQHLFNSHVG